MGAGFLPGQVRVDGRHGDARVGNQAGRDGVAEVHQPTARHGAGRVGNATGSLVRFCDDLHRPKLHTADQR
jgi:hypothetical protein